MRPFMTYAEETWILSVLPIPTWTVLLDKSFPLSRHLYGLMEHSTLILMSSKLIWFLTQGKISSIFCISNNWLLNFTFTFQGSISHWLLMRPSFLPKKLIMNRYVALSNDTSTRMCQLFLDFFLALCCRDHQRLFWTIQSNGEMRSSSWKIHVLLHALPWRCCSQGCKYQNLSPN